MDDTALLLLFVAVMLEIKVLVESTVGLASPRPYALIISIVG